MLGRRSRRSWGVSVAAVLAASAVAPVAWAVGGFTFACVDGRGKTHTSDRYIPECSDRDQRVLNADGSMHHIEKPPMTADERSDMEQRDREIIARRNAELDAARRDRNLTNRFPNEGAHGAAREKALDDVRNSVRISEARVALLTTERKKLLDEAEFYVGKPLPPKLKTSLDANDASLMAQRALIQNQQVEVNRINSLYDVELARLRKLWAGAVPGSLGAPTGPSPPPRGVAPVPVSLTKPESAQRSNTRVR